jgi:hypothetical protein
MFATLPNHCRPLPALPKHCRHYPTIAGHCRHYPSIAGITQPLPAFSKTFPALPKHYRYFLNISYIIMLVLFHLLKLNIGEETEHKKGRYCRFFCGEYGSEWGFLRSIRKVASKLCDRSL